MNAFAVNMSNYYNTSSKILLKGKTGITVFASFFTFDVMECGICEHRETEHYHLLQHFVTCCCRTQTEDVAASSSLTTLGDVSTADTEELPRMLF